MLDIIIIGGGMAGMTAGLYALRNGKKVLLLERENAGGQIAKSPKVENYPTVREISGAELSALAFEQVLDWGIEFELEDVLKVEKIGDTFHVQTNYNSYEAKSVIIATGAKPRLLGLPREEEFTGNGVFYCAICDGPFYAGKEVSIIGDANSALQYALMLASYCKKVNLITLFGKFFAEQNLVDRVLNTTNIEVIHGAKAVELRGETELTSVIFEKPDGTKFEHFTSAVFVAIGQVPDNARFANIAELDKAGYLVADENGATSTAGLFVAGDCRTKCIRQVVTAIGDGANAGTNACKYIDTLG